MSFDPLDPEQCPLCLGVWVECDCDPEEAEAIYALAERIGMVDDAEDR